MKNLKKKFMKIGAVLAVAFALGLQIAPIKVEAALGDPVVVANITVNGVLTPLGNAVATTTVTLVADRPVIFYLYDNPITENYSTTTTILKGFGSPKYSVVDQQGRMSSQITVNLDLNQEPILSGIYQVAGMESVTLNAMKNSYFVVNGVKESAMSISKTFNVRGDYTVYAESLEGLKSNVITFSIPTKAAVTTTPTTPKVTTKPTSKTSTTPKGTTVPTPGQLTLLLDSVMDGGVTSSDVKMDATENVFFVVNGVKDSVASKTKTLTEEGSYTVSLVNAKNAKSAEVSFVIDKTAPTLEMSVNGEMVTPGIFTEPLKITSSEAGVFKVNGEDMYGTDNAILLNKSGTYTVEFYDLAENKTSVDFVLNVTEEEPNVPSDAKGGLGWILYLVIGLVAGAGVALGGTYLMNKRNQ